MKKVTIFGGSGFIGSAITEYFSSRNDYLVRVVDNFSRNYRDLSFMKSVEVVQGDVLNKHAVDHWINDSDVVVNLAYINGTSNFYHRPREVAAVAVFGQLNILESINRSTSVKEFVYASSSEVYNEPNKVPTPEDVSLVIPSIDNPRFSYSGGKIVGEYVAHYLLAPNVRRFVFRPHNVYGPNMGTNHVIPQLLTRIKHLAQGGRCLLDVIAPLNATRSFFHISDFKRAFGLAYEFGGDITINLGSGQETSIEELIGVMRAVTGIDLQLNLLPPLAGSPLRRCPDISKLSDLGFSPWVGLEAGLAECWRELCKR
jgi:nucleoside-diphosphate-sugar epimerase